MVDNVVDPRDVNLGDTQTQETSQTENANADPADEVVTPEQEADSGTAVADTPTAETSEEDGGSHRNRAKERIEDLVAERNAAKEYAEYWRTKALEVIQPTSTQTARAEEPPKETPAPALSDFGNDAHKWSKALTEWTNKQVLVQTQRALEQVENTRTQTATLEAFQSKIEKFKETHADFDILVSNPKLPVLDKTASAMIVASDHSGELTYALAKDPSLAVRIARMNPTQQALAIGRLEADVSKPEKLVDPAKTLNKTTTSDKPVVKPVVKATTQAPPPPTPISGGSAVSPETADISDWMRDRVKTARDRRRR